MTEHKFTDEEIIKALEVCLEGDNCKECPINPNQGNYGYCTGLAMKEALNLINRQKAEVAYWMDAAANAKTEAVGAFAERIKKYYASLGGETAAAGVEYHVDQIAREVLAREEKEGE